MVLAPVQWWKSKFWRRLLLAGLWFVGLIGDLALIALDGYAKRAEEVHVVLSELVPAFGVFRSFGTLSLFDFIEADGGFQHKEDVEAVLTDVLDNPGDLFAFDNGLVDGFTELLDQFAQARCHSVLRHLPARGMAQGGK